MGGAKGWRSPRSKDRGKLKRRHGRNECPPYQRNASHALTSEAELGILQKEGSKHPFRKNFVSDLKIEMK